MFAGNGESSHVENCHSISGLLAKSSKSLSDIGAFFLTKELDIKEMQYLERDQ